MKVRPKAIFFAFAAMILAGYSFYRLVAASRGVPQEFLDARGRGALIAQSIVSMSNQAVGDLEKVNQLDRSRDYAAALDLTVQIANRSDEVRQKAADLAVELEKMTSGLSSVKSQEAKQAGLEAISSRLALIAHLLNYSSDLSDLANVLRAKFTGGVSAQSVTAVIEQINSEVNAINNFNRQADTSMQRFDNLTK